MAAGYEIALRIGCRQPWHCLSHAGMKRDAKLSSAATAVGLCHTQRNARMAIMQDTLPGELHRSL